MCFTRPFQWMRRSSHVVRFRAIRWGRVAAREPVGFPCISPTPGSVDCVDRFCAASLCCVCPQQRQTEEHLTLPQALVWSAACKLSRANQSMRYLRCSLWKPLPARGLARYKRSASLMMRQVAARHNKRGKPLSRVLSLNEAHVGVSLLAPSRPAVEVSPPKGEH